MAAVDIPIKSRWAGAEAANESERTRTSYRLFDQEILPSGKLTLAEQIHDIMCREIHSGRWRIGDKMPSISALAAESGLSRQPVQQALENLRKEGYVRQARGNGTFLASVLPDGRIPIGSIGILMLEHPKDNPNGWALHEYDHWRAHAIIREAAERNFVEELRYLRLPCDESAIDKIGGVFSDRVKGIISLQPFAHADDPILPAHRIPVVFLGLPSFNCGPCVALDLESGFYQLTREVIGVGHRRILLCGNEFANTHEMPRIFAGFERSMNEAGLPVNREAYDASLRFVPGQLSTVRDFISSYVNPKTAPAGQAATAIVCTLAGQAMNIISVADMIGIRVPEDLSVVCMVSGPMRVWKPDQRLTGIEYDLDHVVRICFYLLDEQMRTRKSLLSLVRVKALFAKGDSLAPPRKD